MKKLTAIFFGVIGLALISSSCLDQRTKKEKLKAEILAAKENQSSIARANYVVTVTMSQQCYKEDLTQEQCQKKKDDWKKTSEDTIRQYDEEIRNLRQQVKEIEDQEAANSVSPQ